MRRESKQWQRVFAVLYIYHKTMQMLTVSGHQRWNMQPNLLSQIIKNDLLTLMLKPRPPAACLRSTTVLCFRKWEFLIGKWIFWTPKQRILELCSMYYIASLKSPQAHLHLIGNHFLLCKPHPTSVWLMPLWSISGRRHRYCWSLHCTAKQFQILSVGIEKNIDILPSRAIMYTMNIFNPLFSMCHLCTLFHWFRFGLIGFALWKCKSLWRERKDCILSISYLYNTEELRSYVKN